MSAKKEVTHAVAQSRIEFGASVAGKNTVFVFEPGQSATADGQAIEDVIKGKTFDDLIKCGAIKIERAHGAEK
jgi:hypothetical protein